MEKIENCIITGGTTNIVKYYVDSIKDPRYKEYHGYHSGVDLTANSVYSLFPGQVIFVGNYMGKYSVTVRFDLSNCFRFDNLISCNVSSGDYVDFGSLLGSCDEFVHVEYINLTQSMWCVRLCGIDYYKHDPLDMIQYGYNNFDDYSTVYQELQYFDPTNSNLTESIVDEFTGNKG